MIKWTKEKIIANAQQENVEFINLLSTDIMGTIKNVGIPVSQLEKALSNQITFDGSSLEGLVRIEEEDMFLVPDLETWTVLEPGLLDNDVTSAILVCDVYTDKNEPFKGCSRSNLKRVIKKLDDFGYTDFHFGPEMEFYLFKLDDDGNPTTELLDQGGYFDLSSSSLAADCRRDIVIALEKIGIEVESSHHEVGPSQSEIDLKNKSVVQACDQIQIFKLVAKSVARSHGLYASFMPKPMIGYSGTGMHSNLSLFNEEGNVFYNPNSKNELSDETLYFIGGLLNYARSYTAICNPLVNSYKRLVDGFEAPVYIGWSRRNRAPLVRVPRNRGDSTRIEIRSIDAASNSYLAMSALLTAGLQGIKDKIYPPKALDRNIYMLTREERLAEGVEDLPGSLREALAELRDEPLMDEALGTHIKESFIAEKTMEYFNYQKQVTPWEMSNYFESY